MKRSRKFLLTIRYFNLVFFILILSGVTIQAQDSPFPNEGMEPFPYSSHPVVGELSDLLNNDKIEEAKSVLRRRLKEQQYQEDRPWLRLAGLMAINHKVNDIDELKKYSEELITYAEQKEVNNNVLKAKGQMMLNYYWLGVNRNDSAMYYIDRSLESYLAGPYQEVMIYRQLLNNKFITYDYEFNTEDSLLRICDILREIYDDHYDRIKPYERPIRRSRLFQQYASVYSRLGDYSKAISYMYESLRLIEEDPEQMKEMALYAFTKLELVLAFYNNNQFPQANQIAKEAVAIHEKAFEQDLANKINAYNALAVTYTALNKPDSALVWLNKCLEVIEQTGQSEIVRAFILLNMGTSHTQSGNEKESLEYLDRALRISQSIYGKRHPGLINFYRYMAESNSAFGHHDLAVHHLDSALKSLLPDINEIEEVTQLPTENFSLDILDLIEFYMEEIVASEKSNPDQAGSTQLILDLAAFTENILNQKQQDFIESESVLSNARLYKDVFEHTLVEFALQNPDSDDDLLDRAAQLMYISKSIILNSEVKEFALINDSNVPLALRKDYLNSKRRLQELDNALNRVIATTLNKDSINLLNTEKLKVREAFESTSDTLQNAFWPDRESDTEQQTISKIRADHDLEPGTALIEYFFGKKDILALTVTHNESTLTRTAIGEVFRQRLGKFIDLTSQPGKDQNAARYSEHAQYLFDQLLAPVIAGLETRPDRLILIPDGQLGYLSFELLTTNTAEDFSKLNYLINDYLISYAYSSEKPERPAKPYGHKGMLAFGYGGEGEVADVRAELGDLPGAEKEIDFLKSKFKGSYYLGDKGTKARFMGQSEDYDVLHLALHGKADTLDRYNSRLIFNGDTDFEFNAFDLFALNLNPSMVVLSACETGSGKLDPGEGVFSVARSFASKGIPSIVTTLWKVNDMAGAEIITEFYTNLEQGMAKDEALRQAKLKFLRNADNLTSHPYFWGSYVVMGDTNPIEISKASSFRWYWLLALVLVIFGVSRVGRQPSRKARA